MLDRLEFPLKSADGWLPSRWRNNHVGANNSVQAGRAATLPYASSSSSSLVHWTPLVCCAFSFGMEQLQHQGRTVAVLDMSAWLTDSANTVPRRAGGFKGQRPKSQHAASSSAPTTPTGRYKPAGRATERYAGGRATVSGRHAGAVHPGVTIITGSSNAAPSRPSSRAATHAWDRVGQSISSQSMSRFVQHARPFAKHHCCACLRTRLA